MSVNERNGLEKWGEKLATLAGKWLWKATWFAQGHSALSHPKACPLSSLLPLVTAHYPPPPTRLFSSAGGRHHVRSTFPGHRRMRFQNWRARGMSQVNLIHSWGKPGPEVFREIWWLPRPHSARYLCLSLDLPESFSPFEFTLAHPQKWIWDPQKSPVKKWKHKSREWEKLYVV